MRGMVYLPATTNTALCSITTLNDSVVFYCQTAVPQLHHVEKFDTALRYVNVCCNLACITFVLFCEHVHLVTELFKATPWNGETVGNVLNHRRRRLLSLCWVIDIVCMYKYVWYYQRGLSRSPHSSGIVSCCFSVTHLLVCIPVISKTNVMHFCKTVIFSCLQI